mgnify:FL=1|jgi:hypothetical protein
MTATSTFVSICNLALTELGAANPPITDLADNTKTARACNRIYEQARDQALRDHPWNFALKRIALAADTDTPLWTYANAYTWPTGALRIIECDTTSAWVIEGQKILTDAGAPLNILYIDTITDPTLFDAKFVEAYAAKIAATIAFDITASRTAVADMVTLYQSRLQSARLIDAQESLTADENTWLEARN